jgi:hypothetical protein
MEFKKEPKPEVIVIDTEPKIKMEFKKEPNPEVIIIEMKKVPGVIVIKTEKVSANPKQGRAKIDVTDTKKSSINLPDKKKAVIIKTEKLVASSKENAIPTASAKENILPAAAAAKKKNQAKPKAPIKRKSAPANNNESNNKSGVTKKVKVRTKCCKQETCKYLTQVSATKDKMLKKYGFAALGTFNPAHARRRMHFHCVFSSIAGTARENSPNCATLAARTTFPPN